jgi:hypothetical protein
MRVRERLESCGLSEVCRAMRIIDEALTAPTEGETDG